MGFVVVVTTPGFAQDLVVGTRLQVTRANGKSITGQLAALDERALTLEQRDASGVSKQEVVVSREDILRIEISRAPSRKGHGAVEGLLCGGISGAVLGLLVGQDCPNGQIVCIPRGAATASLGVLFGALGAGIGASLAPGEKWETVGPAHVHVSVIPVRRGARITVAARF
jgi:hypothetical protein